MIKKAVILFSIFSVCLALLAPVLVRAQTGPSVTGSSAEAEYPFLLHFNLSAESQEDITDIRLNFRLERDSYARVTTEVFIEFQPDATVDISWTWDMRRTGGLPPGAGLEFWWTVKDVSGNVIKTTPESIQFDDNRHDWQSLTEGKITIFWYEGGLSFAEDLMSVTGVAMERLTAETGAFLKKAVKLYIYANSDDLRGAMIFPQDWTGGVAYSDYGIIAIGIEPNNLTWGERVIAHELTHLVIHQMTNNPYTGLPTWLSEGLAMYNEGEISRGFTDSLDKAISEDSLISVRSLSSPFSAFADEAILSYAQSHNVVEYLVKTYGQEKMLALLNTFSRGSGYDAALESVYGFDMDDLNTLWQDYAITNYRESGTDAAWLETAQRETTE
ncbi:MAG: peptidase MA family metallohydrolase [Dehalococcoidales bacterium]